jgi:hypothetical protein
MNDGKTDNTGNIHQANENKQYYFISSNAGLALERANSG